MVNRPLREVGHLQVPGRQLFWIRSASLSLVLGLGMVLGCYSEGLDESTRKVHKMTEIFDTEEKFLGVPLKIDQIDFPGAGGPAGGGTTHKLKVFLRGPKGIAALPGNPKAPKGMPGTGAIGKGQEQEIMAALNNGKQPLTPNSGDPPYGLVYMLDANASKTINKGPRVETILALFRPEGNPEKDKTKGKTKLIADLARFGIAKNFDPDAQGSKDKFFVNKKLEPALKEYMEGHSKAINAEELITDTAQQLADGRSQVWFTYLVPVNQRGSGNNQFQGTMALSYKVTWLSKQAAAAGAGGGATNKGAAKAKGSSKDGGEVVFDGAKKAFLPPDPVKRSVSSLRLGADVERAMELYNYRSGAGSSSTADSSSGPATSTNTNTKSK